MLELNEKLFFEKITKIRKTALYYFPKQPAIFVSR